MESCREGAAARESKQTPSGEAAARRRPPRLLRRLAFPWGAGRGGFILRGEASRGHPSALRCSTAPSPHVGDTCHACSESLSHVVQVPLKAAVRSSGAGSSSSSEPMLAPPGCSNIACCSMPAFPSSGSPQTSYQVMRRGLSCLLASGHAPPSQPPLFGPSGQFSSRCPFFLHLLQVMY